MFNVFPTPRVRLSDDHHNMKPHHLSSHQTHELEGKLKLNTMERIVNEEAYSSDHYCTDPFNVHVSLLQVSKRNIGLRQQNNENIVEAH